MVGVGGMGLAAQEMARVQRELRDHIEASRARRDSRLARVRAGQPEHTAPERSDLDCLYLCSTCGYLAEEGGQTCPACSSQEWIDLGHEATALALLDHEQRQRQRSPWWVRVTLGGALAVAAGIAVLLSGLDPLVTTIAGAVAVLGYVFLRRPATVGLVNLTQRKPHRWRLPVPLPNPTSEPEGVLTGAPEFVSEELQAPFSGWQCLAYQICVVFDVPQDARPPECVLQEMHGVDFRVSDTLIPGDRILLRTPPEPVTEEQLRASGLDIQRFLRERGLFQEDGEYTLFESRIDTDEPLRISLRPEPQAILVQPQP